MQCLLVRGSTLDSILNEYLLLKKEFSEKQEQAIRIGLPVWGFGPYGPSTQDTQGDQEESTSMAE
jgi:hypothetical protein